MGLKYRVWWHQLVLHDWSKFTPSEWLGYANHFYAKPSIKQKIATLMSQAVVTREALDEVHSLNALLDQWKEDFLQAWNSHQKHNKHHWQYWVLREDSGKTIALKMPERFVREMVADWAGASIAIRGFDDTLNWYEKNRTIMVLHDESREMVERLIGYTSKEQRITATIELK
jgi:hypothetical protein